MTRTRFRNLIAGVAALPLVALVVAGCGGGGGSSSTAASTKADANATVSVAKRSLGNILVDSQGRTLYLFKRDTGPKSTCFGECANDWPPLRASGEATPGTGLTASKIGTSARRDGKPEVTYNGHPLYLFEGDHKPGDTSGQGLNAFGGAWYVVSPKGSEISGNAPTAAVGSGSGYGY
jgi:predicted lipoprotein with Yx(FWY)xxD motif